MNKITYIFASRSRPEKFFAALDNIAQLSANKNYEIIASLDLDDATMNNQVVKEKISEYPNVKPFFSNSTGKINAINREIKNISQDTDIVAIHSDDMVFVKQDYDLDIMDAFVNFNGLVHFPDQMQQHRLCTYSIMSKNYVDFFGYIYNPSYKSLYADKEQQEVAKKINKYKFVNKKIFEHHHHLWGYGKPDDLSNIDSPVMYEIDKRNYFKYKNLYIITSLSPGHANTTNQTAAIMSWKNIGNCFSMNSIREIDKLGLIYDINFLETDKTAYHLVRKPLVTINAMIDFAIQQEKDLLLLNSDIILYDFPELRSDGITIFSRFDYGDNFMEHTKFEAGFDVFYIPNKFLKIFPQSVFAMGAAWWDYWIPCRAILEDVPLYYHKGEFAYHKLHETQYSFDEWIYMGEFFRLEFNLIRQMGMGDIAANTLEKIKSNLILIS